MEQYGLPLYDADILTSERSLSDYFETAAAAYGGDAKRVSNWVMNDVLKMLNETGLTAGELKLTAEYLAEIIQLVDAKTVNSTTGRTLLEKVQKSGSAPKEIVESEGLGQVSTAGRSGDRCPDHRRQSRQRREIPRRQRQPDRLVCRPGDASFGRQSRSQPGA